MNEKNEKSVSKIVEKIFELLKKSGMQKQEFAEKIGVQKSTISDWGSGRLKPSLDDIVASADLFNKSVDWLLGRKGYPETLAQPPEQFIVADDEKDFLEKYRNLTPGGKQLLMNIGTLGLAHVKSFEEAEPIIQALPKKIPLDNNSVGTTAPVFVQPVAAGTPPGNPTCDYSYEMLEFDDVPPDTDFGVKISGHSMEPEIYDGDIVLVSHRLPVAMGDNGIFNLKGGLVCRKLCYSDSEYSLHSVKDTAKRKDILLKSEPIYTVGKIIKVIKGGMKNAKRTGKGTP